MNFTREPIIETIISAKEGYKLKIKNTKSEGLQEYLVDAVEVVSFGTTFFYRSGEPAHTFFVPAQDFEIMQVRQARLLLKTPTDKAIKIAGGSEQNKKSSADKSKDKKKQKETINTKAKDEKVEKKKEAGTKKEVNTKDDKSKETVKSENKKVEKSKNVKKSSKKASKKSTKQEESKEEGIQDKQAEKPQTSIFSHLLRPPEALISDNIHKYQNIMEDSSDKTTNNEADLTSIQPNPPLKTHEADEELKISLDDANLSSEAPKPFEKLEEEAEEEKPLTLKEKMKKVLSPSVKEPSAKDENK